MLPTLCLTTILQGRYSNARTFGTDVSTHFTNRRLTNTSHTQIFSPKGAGRIGYWLRPRRCYRTCWPECKGGLTLRIAFGAETHFMDPPVGLGIIKKATMGNLFSAVPNAPLEIQPDPSTAPIIVQSASLGMFGGSRSFGVWQNCRPKDGTAQKKEIWLWFNKTIVGGGNERIDLESFRRGHNAQNPKKGQVLFYATLKAKPTFQYFQRAASSGRDSFFGFFTGSAHIDPEDLYYCEHPQHVRRRKHAATTIGHVITKWSSVARVELFDGDCGRAADILQGDPVVLEVYAKGTNVTTYQRLVTQNPGPPKGGGPQTVVVYNNYTTELVDRIEYRLTFRGALWAEWFVPGDADSRAPADPTIQCALFTTTLNGGWFSRSVYTTVTLPEVDPALALLIAHVCATEYSVAQMKSDMKIRVPSRFPADNGLLGNGLAGLAMTFGGQRPQQQWHFASPARA